MIEYAKSKKEADSKLYEKDKEGNTLLDTLETVEKMTGRRPRELTEILESVKPFPEEMSLLWQSFIRMSQRRTVGMQANPISYDEMLNFCLMTNTRFSQLEVETIEKLDEIILNK